ncbi:transposase [Desulfosporosinus sp. SB140]|uniref:transposase n=1 Tax=Desulfosporosinus paludis TaxID=3115649 RepID=UPI00388EC681
MKKYSAKKFLNILKEIQDGATIAETCRKYDIGYSTYYNWMHKFNLMKTSIKKTSNLKRSKVENAKLMQLVVDQALEIQALRYAIRK